MPTFICRAERIQFKPYPERQEKMFFTFTFKTDDITDHDEGTMFLSYVYADLTQEIWIIPPALRTVILAYEEFGREEIRKGFRELMRVKKENNG